MMDLVIEKMTVAHIEEIARLEKQARAEKQPKRKFELVQEIQKLKKQEVLI